MVGGGIYSAVPMSRITDFFSLVVESGISEHPNELSESHFCIILRKKQLIHPCLQLCIAGSSSSKSLQYNFSGFYE